MRALHRPIALALLLMPMGAPVAARASAFHVVQRDLTAWQMFLQADAIVKSVMIALILASIATWAILFAKQKILRGGCKALRADLAALREMRSLEDAQPVSSVPAKEMLGIARDEIERALDLRRTSSSEAMKERLGLKLAAAEANAQVRMLAGGTALASIGATAPFVGLFGTVWGIMNSFIGISEAQTTNLAVVAPGIAEALLATAFGLVAAIPAVVIYNGFSRATAGYRRLLSDTATEVACLVSREVERCQAAGGTHAKSIVAVGS